MMRAFFCLPSDKRLSDELYAISADLRTRINTRVSWVTKRNFHVTIRFLGEINPMLTIDLERMARRIVAEIPPFDIEIDRLGAFPHPARARVIWAGGKASAGFTELVSKVNEGLSELGFPKDRTDPIAHITLGRVKGRPDPALPRILTELDDAVNYPLHVNRLILMESTLTPRGAVYNPLFTLRLTGGKDVSV